MVVLNVIPSKWRLFWVLEVIGLSVTFALLGLRATGNGGDVSEIYEDGCDYGGNGEPPVGCLVYSWFFIFNLHPLSVTIVSFLVNDIVASPKQFVARYMFSSCHNRACLFALLLALWILGTGLFLYLSDWFKSQLVFLVVSAVGLIAWLLFASYKRFFCGGCQRSAIGFSSFRWTWRPDLGLFYLPAGLIVSNIVIVIISTVTGRIGSKVNFLEPTWDPLLVTEALGYGLFNAWLLWGVCRNDASVVTFYKDEVFTVFGEHEHDTEPHEEGPLRLFPLMMNLLLGWVQCNMLFIAHEACYSEFVLPYIERTGNHWVYLPLICASLIAWTWIGVSVAVSNTKGIAFWAVATWLLYHVAYCAWMWSHAVINGNVK